MSPFVPVHGYDPKLLADSTLVFPSVSIGNIPQLTCDLVIHSLKLERVGFIASQTVMPVAGAREAEDNSGVVVAIEVYQSADRKLTVVQQRSPVFKGQRKQYIEDMTAFIKEHAFAQAILLTSADAGRRVDTQIRSTPFRVFGTTDLAEKAVNAGIHKLEQVGEEHEGEKYSVPEITGAGLARPLYDALKDYSVATTLFVMFALEGDNASDAIEYANILNTVTRINPTESSWTPPKAWELLFGTPFNRELYQ